jgi:hypothetical protein
MKIIINSVKRLIGVPDAEARLVHVKFLTFTSMWGDTGFFEKVLFFPHFVGVEIEASSAHEVKVTELGSGWARTQVKWS